MKLKGNLDLFRGTIPSWISTEDFHNLDIVFISEDEGGTQNHNFIYVDVHGKEKNFGKPLTTHFLGKFQDRWVLVTRHNRIRTFHVMQSKDTSMFYFLTTNHLLKQVIWKNEKLYKEFRTHLILETI